MTIIALLALISFLTLKVAQVSTQNTYHCRNYHKVLLYPRTVTTISVINLVPLKVRASFYISQLNQSFSVSGMVCQRGFNSHAARTACRSLGHTKASFIKNFEINEQEVCTFDYKNEHVQLPCRFILDRLNCTNTTVDLMQCSFDPVFSSNCKSNQHIGLTCVTPTTTTKQSVTKTTSKD